MAFALSKLNNHAKCFLLLYATRNYFVFKFLQATSLQVIENNIAHPGGYIPRNNGQHTDSRLSSRALYHHKFTCLKRDCRK